MYRCASLVSCLAGWLCAQKCKWEFLVFSGSFDTQLAVSEDPEAGSLVFRQLQSSFMRDFEGRWQVCTPLAGSPCKN